MSNPEKQLRKIFAQLGAADQQTVLAFAQFLYHRADSTRPQMPIEPSPLPRPAQETVIGAIKRLSTGYPMLDKAKLLEETSSLVSQHVLHGREAAGVIDELEMIFERHYRELKPKD